MVAAVVAAVVAIIENQSQGGTLLVVKLVIILNHKLAGGMPQVPYRNALWACPDHGLLPAGEGHE